MSNSIIWYIRKRILIALPLAILATLCLTPRPAYLATGDADDDGILDTEDNCPYTSNPQQLDEVSTFQLNRFHDGNAIFPNQNIKQIPPIYKPIWVPVDRTTVRIYLAGTLLKEGMDYEWVEQGMSGLDYFSPTTKITISPTTRAGTLLMVVLGDSDDSGNKCSDNLGKDFDGIPEPADNCPLDYNPFQEDTFGSDERGDACEESPDASSKTVQQKRIELADAMYPYAHTASDTEVARVYAETSGPDSPITQAYANLYTGKSYTGDHVRYRTDARALVDTVIGDNTVSSIKIGPHTELTLYKTANYQGTLEKFYADDSDFTDNGLGENTASSLRLASTAPILVSVFEQKSESDKRIELAAAGYPYATTASKSEINLVYEQTAVGYASIKLIQLWSGAQGFVGHIVTSELETVVSGGAGTVIELQRINNDNFQSVDLTYNGNGEYQVYTKNLDGSPGETAHFHYAGVPENHG